MAGFENDCCSQMALVLCMTGRSLGSPVAASLQVTPDPCLLSIKF